MGLLYQKRRLKVNKIRRRIASCRAMLQRFRVLLSLCLIAGIIYFGIWILNLPQWYIDTEKLAAADSSVLKIQGNNITADYKIINMIRQTKLPQERIFMLDTSELEKNISQLKTIKKVYIRRYWFPARLNVTVEERVPAFLLSPNLNSEANSALTTDGILIDYNYFPFKSPISTKKLLTYGVKDGRDEVWDKKKVEKIIKLTKAIETYSNQEVQYIDLRNDSDIYIMLKDYLVRFGEINDTYLTRAKYIASVLPLAEQYGKKTKYIDLRWEKSKYIRLDGVKEPEEEKNKENKPKENKKDTKETKPIVSDEQQNTIQEEEPQEENTSSSQENDR